MNKDLNNLIFILNLFLEHQCRLKAKKVFHTLLLQASKCPKKIQIRRGPCEARRCAFS